MRQLCLKLPEMSTVVFAHVEGDSSRICQPGEEPPHEEYAIQAYSELRTVPHRADIFGWNL